MHTCHLCCVCVVTVHVNMWRATSVSVSHFPLIAKEFTFPTNEKNISQLNKKTSVQSKMTIAKNSNFCSTSNHRAAPTELTKTNVLDCATNFPLTSKDGSIDLKSHSSTPSNLWPLRCLDRCTR